MLISFAKQYKKKALNNNDGGGNALYNAKIVESMQSAIEQMVNVVSEYEKSSDNIVSLLLAMKLTLIKKKKHQAILILY